MFNKSEARMEICKKCPLYQVSSVYGAQCNPNLYINRDGKVSKLPMPGFVKGCGCKLSFKTKNAGAHCIVGKW